MEKIKLERVTKTKPKNQSAALNYMHEPMMLTMQYNGEDVYSFSGDIETVEEMIEWLYDNTTKRFTFLGTENIYFESSEDAMAFKLRWL